MIRFLLNLASVCHGRWLFLFLPFLPYMLWLRTGFVPNPAACIWRANMLEYYDENG